METRNPLTLMAAGLSLLFMVSAHAAEMAHQPMKSAPKAANPCAVQEGVPIDPRQITRPADIPPFSGVERSVLLEEGRMLFEDSSLSGNGMSCNSCHKTDALFKPSFATPYPHPFEMARRRAGVDRAMFADEVVQFCLLVPMKGQPLPWDSRELAALTTYVVDVRQREFIAAVRDFSGGMDCPNGEKRPCGTVNPCGMMNPCGMKNPCGVKH